MKRTHRFRELMIWKDSISFAKDVYGVTSKFPEDERFGLISQLRRASVSVSSNIAEGSSRSSDKDFRNFLYNSMGSLREVESQLFLSCELGFLAKDKFEELISTSDKIAAKVSRFMQSLIV
jgi:four helix bundle protein